MDSKKPEKGATTCGTSMSAQKESLRAIPNTTGNHKNPEMKPVGDKAMTGAKLN